MTRRPISALGLATLALTLGACGSSSSTTASTSSAPAAGCPADPVAVVVSVDQWGDIVSQLAGDCGNVTTVIANSSADPHDYEPTTGDIAKFTDAKLVVVNGADYDPWATKAVETLPTKPALVDAGVVNGITEGGNPHIWFGPAYIEKTAAAVTEQLKSLAPAAAGYFDERAAAWQTSMKPYFAEIDKIKAGAAGATYGATESVFDYMAEACGLVNKTPQGYQNAAAAESDPAPGDVLAFNEALTGKVMKVLIYNTQTEGAIPAQIRATAEGAKVPVVEVTETVAPGFTSFADWQVSQLQALSTALGIA